MPIYREGQKMDYQAELCQQYQLQQQHHQECRSNGFSHRCNQECGHYRQSERFISIFLLIVGLLMLGTAMMQNSQQATTKQEAQKSYTNEATQLQQPQQPIPSQQFIDEGKLKAVSYEGHVRNAAKVSEQRPPVWMRRIWM